MAKQKIVLAYSGGLDTSVILTWLKETFDAEIITFTADIGQKEELDGLEEKALRTGVSGEPFSQPGVQDQLITRRTAPTA